MRRVGVNDFLAAGQNALLIDVRSPSEYKHAHVPGAINLPLFSDAERAVVGTTYKQVSREAAIKIGLDYFGPKMRPLVEQVESLIEQRNKKTEGQGTEEQEESNDEVKLLQTLNVEPGTTNPQRPTSNTQLFVYCWRGGMRSGAVAWLLNLYGFDVTVLDGGYKAFRNHVLQSFELPYKFRILGGYTGSGKTEVLQQLKAKGEKTICLESIASHKGSAFGNINMPPQPSQEMFENLLSSELLHLHSNSHDSRPIWLEDESQRIGTVNLPNALWNTMRAAPVYFLEIPFEERLQHITEEYSRCDKERLANAIERIKKRLGGLETKLSLQALAEDDYETCFRILLHYYDKQYLKGLHNRENAASLLTEISCKKVSEVNADLLSQAQLVS